MMPVRTVEQQTQTLADYLPGGQLYHAKNIHDSNFRKLLRGLAEELFRGDGYVSEYKWVINPSVTENFLDEWESAVGIPDGCFTGDGGADTRRQDILIKLASLGVQTAEDFEALASLFGITVEVRSAAPHAIFPMTFPIYFTGSVKAARFTILVTFTVDAASRFPLTFPFKFGDAEIGILECLFRRLKPANCDIIFQQV